MILTPGYTRRSIIPELQKRTPKLVEVADSSRGRLARSVYDWLSGMKDLSMEELQNPVILDAWLTRTAHGSGIATDQHSVEESFSRIMNLGAHVGLDSLSHIKIQRRDIASEMAFSTNNTRIAAKVESYALNLITSISQDTQNSIRRVLVQSLRTGQSPIKTARDIKSLIGLSGRQMLAVQNYREALESGAYRAAMDRALRDGRYDATLLRALKDSQQLKQAQIDRMVERYAERQLKYRAELIARTESIRAANAGLLESWQQAKEQGLMPDQMRMFWIVSRDERTCEICKEVPHMNANRIGVPIGGVFWLPTGGHVDHPPAHPDCRCTMGLR